MLVGLEKINTRSGGYIDLLNPDPKDINLTDIAVGLANTCRFGGQMDQHYSVAQHSIYVAQKSPFRFKLRALMHDAAEAYLGDIQRPIKRLLSGYHDLEVRFEAAINKKFRLKPLNEEDAALLKEIDTEMCATERQLLNNDPADIWIGLGRTLPDKGFHIPVWEPKYAYQRFIEAFENLSTGDFSHHEID